MEKIITFSFFMVVFVVALVDTLYTYTDTVCDDHSMFTSAHCHISVQYSTRVFWNSSNSYYKSKFKVIFQEYILTFPSVGFTHRTLDELITFKRRCRKETKSSREPFAYYTHYNIAIKASSSGSFILNASMTYMPDVYSQLDSLDSTSSRRFCFKI